jgi:hypothetical protein
MPPGRIWILFFTALDLYSPNGATWTVPTSSWANNPAANALRSAWNPSFFYLGGWNINGSGHDSLQFSATDYDGDWAGTTSFNDILAIVSNVKFPLSDSGKTFCIDSCDLFPPSLDWVFGDASSGAYTPAFGGGPYAANYTAGMGYCFTLAVPSYICGDINNNGTITIADMVYLVAYLVNNGPAIPNPWIRADANCSRGIGPTVADNNYMVQYLFNGGPAPCTNCPH